MLFYYSCRCFCFCFEFAWTALEQTKRFWKPFSFERTWADVAWQATLLMRLQQQAKVIDREGGNGLIFPSLPSCSFNKNSKFKMKKSRKTGNANVDDELSSKNAATKI